MKADDEISREPESEDYLLSVILRPGSDPGIVFNGAGTSSRDFADEGNAKLYAAVERQWRNTGAIEPTLAAREVDKYFGGAAAAHVLELGQRHASAALVKTEAAKVIEASRKRQQLEICNIWKASLSNGHTSRKSLSELLANVDALRNDEKRQEVYTLKELAAAFPNLNPPVLNGLAREGEILNIISYSKFGKSWMIYALGLSIVVGRSWFDLFETSPGKILLVDNELHASTIAHRVYAVANAMGIPPQHYENDFEIRSLRGDLRSFREVADDLLETEPHRYKAIFFDAKYRFATPGISENDNGAETLFYNAADEVGAHTCAMLAFVHHASKGDQSGKRVTDTGSGAGAQSRAADCHVVLREHEQPGVAVLEAAVRSFAPVEPLSLRWQFPLWVPDSAVDPAKLKGRQTKQEERQEEKDREGVEVIIKALRGTPATARQLREKTGIGPDRQQRLLDWMVAEGHATYTETTVRGNVCREYKLIEE